MRYLWFAGLYLLEFFGGSAAPAEVQQVDVYAVAHPDDAQVFFMPNLEIDVANGDRVLLLILTAGDAGRTDGYWQAREEGVKASIRLLVGPGASESQEVLQANGHAIHTWTYGPATIAFFRVPDGGGLGAERCGGHGTPAYQCQSLSGFRPETQVTTVDGVERYGDAGDLNRTVISVMRQLGVQSGELLPWINTFEPNESLNPRDHPDHLDVFYFVNGFGSSGRSGSVTAGAHWAFFRGDSVLNEPANLTREQHEQKAAVFGAYYFAVVDAYGAGATEMCAAPGNEADYAAVLWRQYLTAEVE